MPGLTDLFAQLARERRFAQHSAVTFIRGPSRTADIELTLTIGVHGPRRLYVIVLDPSAPLDESRSAVTAGLEEPELVGGFVV